MIKVCNLSKTYYGEPVFKNVSFVLAKNLIIGLIGENGAGKTTLLKILAGETKNYEGTVKIERENIGYMPQEIVFDGHDFVGEFIENKVPVWEKYKFDMALRLLGFGYYDEYQKFSTLSGGEKTKLFLASLMVEDPTLLLLDEPTNHLDLESMIALQEFLVKFCGKVVVVSHDRDFLDNIVSQIWELDGGKFKKYHGNYSNYLFAKEKQIVLQHRQYIGWVKKKEKLEQLIKNARSISDGKSRGSAIGAAKKRYEREVVSKEVTDPFAKESFSKIQLSGSSHTGKLIVKVIGYAKTFGTRKVLDGVSFEVRGNEKVWLYGRNGSGKTTILKAVISSVNESNLSAEIKVGSNLSVGYYSQTQDILDLSSTLEGEMQRLGGVHWEKAISMLKNLRFEKNDWDKKVSMLSFGQRARLIFGAFSLGNYNFLVMDEPTNFLDIKTRAIIENALIEYKGAMLLVSHDRCFVKGLNIDRMLILSDGIIKSERVI